jgi:hypothetical protein
MSGGARRRLWARGDRRGRRREESAAHLVVSCSCVGATTVRGDAASTGTATAPVGAVIACGIDSRETWLHAADRSCEGDGVALLADSGGAELCRSRQFREGRSI